MSGLNKNVNKKRESMDGQNSNGIKSTPPNETTSFLQVKSADEMETVHFLKYIIIKFIF